MLPHKSLITITLLAKIKIDTVLIHSTHQNIEMSEYLELSQIDGRFAVCLRCILQMADGPGNTTRAAQPILLTFSKTSLSWIV